MTEKDFNKMFLLVLDKFNENIKGEYIKEMNANKDFIKRAKKKCELNSYRTLISVHDSLFHLIQNDKL